MCPRLSITLRYRQPPASYADRRATDRYQAVPSRAQAYWPSPLRAPRAGNLRGWAQTLACGEMASHTFLLHQQSRDGSASPTDLTPAPPTTPSPAHPRSKAAVPLKPASTPGYRQSARRGPCPATSNGSRSGKRPARRCPAAAHATSPQSARGRHQFVMAAIQEQRPRLEMPAPPRRPGPSGRPAPRSRRPECRESSADRSTAGPAPAWLSLAVTLTMPPPVSVMPGTVWFASHSVAAHEDVHLRSRPRPPARPAHSRRPSAHPAASPSPSARRRPCSRPAETTARPDNAHAAAGSSPAHRPPDRRCPATGHAFGVAPKPRWSGEKHRDPGGGEIRRRIFPGVPAVVHAVQRQQNGPHGGPLGSHTR